MDLGIKGRRALVLGGSKGLGYASAHALAQEGVAVAVASSSLERCTESAQAIAKETGSKAVPVVGDVSDPDNMDKAHAAAVKALGGDIDILVNNHGGPPLGMAKDLKEADLKNQFTGMVVSMIRMTSLCFPPMVARKWGRIMFVGSSGMIQALPNMVLSNTLRGCIVGYCKTLASELAADNVTVNIVAPGTILTDRSRSSNEQNAKRRGITVEEVMAERVKTIPAGRLGDPTEYGSMVAFLAGDKSSYMTGSIWRVDGGIVRSIL
ncbi:MAG: SDR family oxidoreductase [Acetobacterales bacterium]